MANIDKKFEFECTCGCSSLVFTDWNDDDLDIISISHRVRSWGNQRPVRKALKQMFKLIWCAITGQQFWFYELVVERSRLEDFKRFVNSIDEGCKICGEKEFEFDQYGAERCINCRTLKGQTL
jgi:hypothetical protein